MRKFVRQALTLALTLPLAAAASACTPTPAREEAERGVIADDLTLVPRILAIRCAIEKSNPPALAVSVDGEVNTGGWTDPQLTPRDYATPPSDGVWEYDLRARAPTEAAIMVLSPIQGEHRWPDYPAATLTGIRVYGVDEGVREVRLSECGER